MSADVARAVDEAIAQYRTLGATMVEVSLPNSKLSVPAYYVLAPAEASSRICRVSTACATAIARPSTAT
jgi:aspartyl-tRNA(Asn)/glutamyl-tRNA(Gln) amidotransferase subunit A